MRETFFRFQVVIVAFTAAMLASRGVGGWVFGGGIAIFALMAIWLWGHRRGEYPAWTLVVEGSALLVLGVAAGDPMRALGLMYFSLWFRAFYGSTRMAVALTVTWVVAHVGAIAAAVSLGSAPSDTALLSPDVLTQAPGFAMTVYIIRVLVDVAARRREDARRQQVLGAVGGALGVATSVAEVAEVACDAAAALVDGRATTPTLVALLDGAALQVVAATEPELVGTSLAAPGQLDGGSGHALDAGHVVVETVDGAAVWDLLSTAVPVHIDGSVQGAIIVRSVASGVDAALRPLAVEVGLGLARTCAALELQSREARFRSLVDNANDVIRILDSEGTIIYESAPVFRVLGRSPEQLVGRSAFELMHPDDVAAVRHVFATMIDDPTVQPPVVRCRLAHADGSWRHVEGSPRNLLHDPAVRGYVINYRDVTEQRRLEADLEHRALHDPLTELPNRTLFHHRLERAVHVQQRTQEATAVVYIDLDDFKTINDGLGHHVGDEVLKAVADRLTGSVRASDTCARLGGDEFAIILDGLQDLEDAHTVAARTLDRIGEPLLVDDHRIEVRASAGIAFSTGAETAGDLTRNADVAMYRAKVHGKAAVEVFEIGMDKAVRDRIALKADLERGVRAGEFVAHYQPIVDLDSQHIVGVEALVRWAHPLRGVLAPGAFLEAAEETGLIVPIGRQVLTQAGRDLAAWRREHSRALTLNVNLSAPELAAPDIGTFLRDLLSDNHLPGEAIVVEITETMLLTDAAAAAATLAELRELGVRLALDDFGTGYSSLAYLERFPVDVVKIDKTFVDSLGHGTDESPLAAAILGLGRSLGLDVSAEGVETDRQWRRLQELGCRQAQGYYFCKPVPASDVFPALPSSVDAA